MYRKLYVYNPRIDNTFINRIILKFPLFCITEFKDKKGKEKKRKKGKEREFFHERYSKKN